MGIRVTWKSGLTFSKLFWFEILQQNLITKSKTSNHLNRTKNVIEVKSKKAFSVFKHQVFGFIRNITTKKKQSKWLTLEYVPNTITWCVNRTLTSRANTWNYEFQLRFHSYFNKSIWLLLLKFQLNKLYLKWLENVFDFNSGIIFFSCDHHPKLFN